MIKRALIALALLMAALVPIGLTASPAAAAGCATTTTISSSTTWDYAGGTWSLTSSANIQRCTTTIGDRYSKVYNYRVIITNVGGGCGSQYGHPVTGWRVNPDVLGAWNPAQKENSSCSGTFTWTAPAGMVVWASATFDQRCIGADATPKLFLWPDGSPVNVPGVCVTA